MEWLRPTVVVALMILGFATLSLAQEPAKAALTLDDCAKCHTAPPADIASAGAGHKTITCFDCHASHRPAARENIPQCSQCHSGKPHYELKDCIGCHKNPHTPLKVSFANDVTDPCLTCHSQQIKQLKENKSKHSNLACSGCHATHRIGPECLQCHKPHSTDMTQADCKSCHNAHMPLAVTYGTELPNKSCGACHKKAMELLSANKSKHNKLACAFCHAAKHKTIPTCESCHGAPHAAGILQKYPKCSDCHFTAHDLNNLPVASAAKEAVPEAKKERGKRRR